MGWEMLKARDARISNGSLTIRTSTRRTPIFGTSFVVSLALQTFSIHLIFPEFRDGSRLSRHGKHSHFSVRKSLLNILLLATTGHLKQTPQCGGRLPFMSMRQI